MKYFILFLFAGLMLNACSSSKSASATSTLTTTTFKARGLCGMCKDRIETTALSTKGVKTAVWNDEAQTLTIQFDPAKTSADAVEQKIANVGHDTEKYKAPDAVYAKLPGCCQYDREQ